MRITISALASAPRPATSAASGSGPASSYPRDSATTEPSATRIVSSQTQRLTVNVCQPVVLTVAPTRCAPIGRPVTLPPYQWKKNMKTASATAPTATIRRAALSEIGLLLMRWRYGAGRAGGGAGG